MSHIHPTKKMEPSLRFLRETLTQFTTKHPTITLVTIQHKYENGYSGIEKDSFFVTYFLSNKGNFEFFSQFHRRESSPESRVLVDRGSCDSYMGCAVLVSLPLNFQCQHFT